MPYTKLTPEVYARVARAAQSKYATELFDPAEVRALLRAYKQLQMPPPHPPKNVIGFKLGGPTRYQILELVRMLRLTPRDVLEKAIEKLYDEAVFKRRGGHEDV